MGRRCSNKSKKPELFQTIPIFPDERPPSFKRPSSRGGFPVQNLKDAYFTIPIAKQHRKCLDVR